MKYCVSILLMILLNACEALLPRNWDSSPDRIFFNVFAEEGGTFREVRIYVKELENGKVITFDSTIFNARNRNGTEETFSKNSGPGLTFFADSLLKIQDGWFEAVALRKDSVLLEQKFGRIWNGNTHRDYKVILTKSAILVDEI